MRLDVIEYELEVVEMNEMESLVYGPGVGEELERAVVEKGEGYLPSLGGLVDELRGVVGVGGAVVGVLSMFWGVKEVGKMLGMDEGECRKLWGDFRRGVPEWRVYKKRLLGDLAEKRALDALVVYDAREVKYSHPEKLADNAAKFLDIAAKTKRDEYGGEGIEVGGGQVVDFFMRLSRDRKEEKVIEGEVVGDE